MRGDLTGERLADYFREGIDPVDVTALHTLHQARHQLQAMQALFAGTEAALLVRLLVLREVGTRGEQPYWAPAELRGQFPYLDSAKLDNIILHLRSRGLLAWDDETQRYSLSPLGRMVIAALSVLLRFSDEGSELGYLVSQLAASRAVGRVSQAELQHLLSRLTEHKDEFERAILSGSEARIRDARRRFESAIRWVERGSEVMQTISQDPLDGPAHRVAQSIGRAQSELLRMSGAFQRALNKLESQKVHLGATGLSSSDINTWLRTVSVYDLAGLAAGTASAGPQFAFALGDLVLDVAEYELIDKERPERLDVPLPPPADAPVADGLELEPPDWREVDRWRDQLRIAPDGLPLDQAVPLRDYELSGYRLSLLALLGDRESAALDGPVAELARLDRRPEWAAGIATVAREGVAEMSSGRLRMEKADGT